MRISIHPFRRCHITNPELAQKIASLRADTRTVIGDATELELGELCKRVDPAAARWLFNRLIKEKAAVELFPQPVYNKDLDVYYRPHTTDLEIIRAARRYCRFEMTDDDVFLDIGAHIGSISRFYAKQQRGQVVALEPEPENFEVLKLNTEGFHVELLQAAVVADDRQTVSLFMNGSSINRGLASLIPRKSRYSVEVSAINMTQLLVKYRPTMIKIDINGTEYDHLETFKTHLSDVKYIMVEVHRLMKEHYVLAGPFIEWLRSTFTLINPPNFDSGSFVFEVFGERK